MVAAAILGAPAVAVTLLAAIGVANVGHESSLGSLAGAAGLDGSTPAPVTTAPPRDDVTRDGRDFKDGTGDSGTRHARNPSHRGSGRVHPQPPARTPAQPTEPKGRRVIGTDPTPGPDNSPYDPSGPGSLTPPSDGGSYDGGSSGGSYDGGSSGGSSGSDGGYYGGD